MEKIKGINNEAEAWKYINKNRKKKKTTSENISEVEWRHHFMQLLGGREEGKKNETQPKRTEGPAIKLEEVERQIEKLKKSKAPGGNGIENEVWMYGTKKLRERLCELLNEVWKGRGFPREWREGIICPIHKKGDREEVKNYRGITLLNTAYKIYAMVLEERMRAEMDERGMLPDGQAGFRKRRGTMDNVYILHHLAESEIRKEGGRLYTMFVDLKAAFDSVKREKLWECLRKRGMSEWMVERLEEIYEETKSRVRVNGEESKEFYTTEGLRQGCPLSPSLFAAYLGDIEDMFRREQAGGVVVGRMKV